MDRLSNEWTKIAALLPESGHVTLAWLCASRATQVPVNITYGERLAIRRCKQQHGQPLIPCQQVVEQAAKQGKVVLLRSLLVDWQAPCDKGRVWSFVAAHGSLEMCHVLKDCGWSLHSAKGHPLQCAANGGHSHVFQFWKDQGLTLRDLRQHRNFFVLSAAAHRGSIDVCQLFLDWRDTEGHDGRVVSMTASDIRPALARAAEAGHAQIVQAFKEWRGLPEGAPDSRLTLDHVRAGRVLEAAALGGDIRILQLLKDWRDPNPGAEACDQLTLERDVLFKGSQVLFNALYANHIHSLEFFRNWIDPSGFRLTLENAMACDPMLLTWASNNVNACRYLRDWRDDSGFCLTLENSDAEAAWEEAATTHNADVCQFLKDWTDEDGSRLAVSEDMLHTAVRARNLGACHQVKDWINPDGSRLTADNARNVLNEVTRCGGFEGNAGRMRDTAEIRQFLADWLNGA